MACAARSAAEEGGASLPGSGTGRLSLGRAIQNRLKAMAKAHRA